MRTTNVMGSVLAALVFTSGVLAAPTGETAGLPLVERQPFADRAVDNEFACGEAAWDPAQLGTKQNEPLLSSKSSEKQDAVEHGAMHKAHREYPNQNQESTEKSNGAHVATGRTGTKTIRSPRLGSPQSVFQRDQSLGWKLSQIDPEPLKVLGRDSSLGKTLLGLGEDLDKTFFKSAADSVSQAMQSSVASRDLIHERNPSWESTLLSAGEDIAKNFFENAASSAGETAGQAVASSIASSKRYSEQVDEDLSEGKVVGAEIALPNYDPTDLSKSI
ncbi:hypothetical protein BD289DRAFT_450865 [Coniella lustricola]|uniref:Uncharacterized protein n=1 Tax=Coniella lustricola TaxID=2025994 RepID=A0A2T3AH47_9PEZI|nr:hypothetical protein BD289DRAFT_450865 [Coniella lustricola]